ncbi:Gfo/Idh/MocA family oxidoreductase [bacterium]|nr:Gfo/Idh/MocA family oxidoreductase [bacterium]
MDVVNVGIIGSGYWGPNLIRNFVENSTSEVVSVADLQEDRLKRIKARYPKITVTTDYRSFFEMDIDAVVIATPPNTHYPIAKDCLEHGISVFVEKPITLKAEDAEDLIAIAEANGLTLMVGHTFEYNDAVRELKKIIESGELGKVFYIDAARLNLGLFHPNLNVVWDLAPHDISILNFILQSTPVSVSAQGMSCILSGVHDVAYLNLVYPNDIVANVHVSWIDPAKVRRVTVVGSEKMVVYNDISSLEKIKIFDKRVQSPDYTNTFEEFQLSYHYGDVLIPNINFREPLSVECQHYISSIINKSKPQSNGRVGLEVVRVLEAAQYSLLNGGERVMLDQNASTTNEVSNNKMSLHKKESSFPASSIAQQTRKY